MRCVEQWHADIDCTRRELAWRTGRVMVYGASGGQLAQLYLAAYGQHVTHCHPKAAVFTKRGQIYFRNGQT